MIVVQQQALRNQYWLVQDSYTGMGKFSSGEYLFPFGREPDFKQRKERASYFNLIAPMVQAKVDPCFSDTPKRVYNDELLEEFLENADNNGTSLTDIIHHTTFKTTLLGNSFIIMDNFPESELPESYSEAVATRKFPFVYTKEVMDVYSYEIDMFGKLKEISFLWGEIADPDGTKYLYKKFTPSEIEFFTIKGANRSTVSLTSHNLGIVPVIYFNKEVLPFSPYYSTATLARKLYNTSSQADDLSRDQNYSILILPSNNKGGDPKEAIELGTKNALFVDSDATNTPTYISPDSAQLTVSTEYQKSIVDQIIQSGDVLGTSSMSNNSNSTSGIQESYRFFGKMQALKLSSKISEALDKDVVHMLGLFMNTDYEYEVKYQDKFAPSFSETQAQLAVLERIADRNISDEFNNEIYKDIASIIGGFMGWDDERLAMVVDSVGVATEVINEPTDIMDEQEI